MRCSERDKRPIHYALYTGKTPVQDNGKYTGEYTLTYGNPVRMMANYSAGSDTLTVGEYGIKEQYDRILITTDMSCPIAEDTRIWIGIPTSLPHNYVVSKKEDSVRAIRYGLTKVKVSANQTNTN